MPMPPPSSRAHTPCAFARYLLFRTSVHGFSSGGAGPLEVYPASWTQSQRLASCTMSCLAFLDPGLGVPAFPTIHLRHRL